MNIANVTLCYIIIVNYGIMMDLKLPVTLESQALFPPGADRPLMYRAQQRKGKPKTKER